jgi:hypothetical protein
MEVTEFRHHGVIETPEVIGASSASKQVAIEIVQITCS